MSAEARGLLPAMFRVGAKVGMVNGGGRLIIEPEALIFEPDWPTRRLSGLDRLVHTDTPVAVVKARLVPPWFNTSVGLREGETSAYVVVPMGSRRRLLVALKAAGFHPTEVSHWLRLAP